MADPHKALLLAAVNRWNKTHGRGQQIDKDAEFAVAGQEGLSGGVGDGGHAFGANQANDAGGVLTGKLPANWTPQQKNAWAWSPQGLEFQLSGVAAAAGGEHGSRAIEDIVRKYERPADPNGEISRALGGAVSFGGQVSQFGAGSPGDPSSSGAPAADIRRAFAQNLLGSLNSKGVISDGPGFVQALQARQGSLATAPQAAPFSAPSVGPRGGLTSVDGVQVDPAVAAMVASVVKQFGVTPTSGYRDPSHNAAVGGAQHSDHLSGDAVDFGGNPAALKALYQYAQGKYPYVEPWAQSKNHVHISFARNGR